MSERLKPEQRSGVYLGKPCSLGHIHSDGQTFRTRKGACVDCEKDRLKRHSKTPMGRASAKRRKTRYKPKLVLREREYRLRNADERAEYNKAYRAARPEWMKKYYQHYNSLRRARRLRAMPSWVDKEEIRQIYLRSIEQSEVTGSQHHVDHIVPLTHPDVCGLHVAANLRIVPARTNLQKRNTLLEAVALGQPSTI